MHPTSRPLPRRRPGDPRPLARSTSSAEVPDRVAQRESGADGVSDALIRRLRARFGSPLMVVDCARIRRQYRALRSALPGVDLHYAVKALPLPEVVSCLHEEGAHFDLATTGEAALLQAQGVPGSRCIQTHPIKRDSDIADALRFGITTFVVDNPDEVAKFERHRTRAELLLRVAFRSPDAVCDLSRKFGCDPADVPDLIELAARSGIRVRGLSFHVGSQASNPAKHVEAIRACAALLACARSSGLAGCDVLDIGGGFPVSYLDPVPPIDEFCAPIRAEIDRLPPDVRVIAEPGRFIAAPAGTSISTVMGRARRGGCWWYYLDDGIYGSYSGRLFDHARYPIRVPGRGGEARASVLAGPTCDSIDVIEESLLLPELEIGDVVVGGMMGAYTVASATDFNFFDRARVVVLDATPAECGTGRDRSARKLR